MSRDTHTPQRLSDFLSVTVFSRAAIIALIIGSLLTLINQGNAVLGDGEIAMTRLVLVFVTPFLVVLFSQALGAQQAALDASLPAMQTLSESPLRTMIAHGIPMRAAIIGGLMGTLNTAALAASNMATAGTLGPLPSTPLIQAYALPVVFGLLSQAVAYRRMAAEISAAHQTSSRFQTAS